MNSCQSITIISIIAFVIWFYLLTVFHRAKVLAWEFIWGSSGTFLFSMIFLKDELATTFSRLITAVVGVIGDLTGMFVSYYNYSSIFIDTDVGGILLQIDIECSGIIEILVFLSLLMFFRVYRGWEKLLYSLVGLLYIVIGNGIRVVVICFIVYYFGYDSYHVAHSYIGRILFYGLSVLLYYYIFTKPQILSMRVGNFKYDTDNRKESERDRHD